MSKNSAGSSNQHQFAKAPMVSKPRSTFDRSASVKTTCDAGLCIPFWLDEVIPGDTMTLSTNVLARLATPIFPYMDNLWMDIHYFFVPNRLVWDNWEKQMGAQTNPGDTTDYLTPQIDLANYLLQDYGSLTDYFGLPILNGGGSITVLQADMPSALPYRAYALIWNEWYRDENLQNSQVIPMGNGPDQPNQVQPRGRRKDYFTSALPWPQKGPSSVLPLGVSAPIRGFGSDNQTWSTGPVTAFETGGTGAVNYAKYKSTSTASPGDMLVQEDPANPGFPLVWADLSSATAATINQLRQAATLQQLFETDARGGTRYVELLLAHFGVTAPDFRLQRPEYLGGGTISVNVNPIAQTSATDGSTPQGNLAAFATANGRQGFHHSFVEHGFVFGIMSFRAETSYQGGQHKMWNRRTRYDYYWPTLAHLGEQAVLNKELFVTGNRTVDNAVFGYQERFAEYRYKPSYVTGKFRSNDPQSLDSWHLTIDFGATGGGVAVATLASLVVENPPVDRIIAVPSEPQFIVDTYTSLKHTRPMPTYSVPGLSRL